jgi:hypothetical protein
MKISAFVLSVIRSSGCFAGPAMRGGCVW